MTRHTPQWVQSGSYAAVHDRRLISAVWPAAASSGLAVTPYGAGLGANIAPGYAAVPSANNTGSVLCYSDANEVVPVIPVLTPGNRRFDIVYLEPRAPDFNGSANTDFVFLIDYGLEGPTPPPPALRPGTLPLAELQILYGDTVLGPLSIRDLRPGGIPPAGGGGDPGGVILYQQGLPSGRYTVTTASSYPADLTKTFATKPGRWYKIWLFIWAENNSAVPGNWSCNLETFPAALNRGGNSNIGDTVPKPVAWSGYYSAEHYAQASGDSMTFRAQMFTSAGTMWLFQGANFAKLVIVELPDATGGLDV